MLQKIAIENSLFILVVFLFRTHGRCANLKHMHTHTNNTHMHTVTLSCLNWGVPKIFTFLFCCPWEGMTRAFHQDTPKANSNRKLSRLKRGQLILLAVASEYVPNL